MSAKHRTVVQFDYKPPISEVSMENNIKQYKNPYDNQYVAPDYYCFYNSDGERLGKIIWVNNTDGIYIDKDLLI